VKSHLIPHLPKHDVVDMITGIGGSKSIDSVSSAPYGNALVLPISYAYIKMMGNEGLPFSSVIAMLNSNYMMTRLKDHYKILFVNEMSTLKHCAHEFIVDLREYKAKGVEAIDVAKRLQDYGFHAPTLAFPVPGTLMIEPTESENLEELDRFCDAMISIKEEINALVAGQPKGQILKNAPHSLEDLITSSNWDTRGYTREEAAYPLPFLRYNKFWPTVARLDDTYGDMNLICTCPSVEEIANETE
ncbi:YMR189Wp-like protein, partial [Saccharomyces cerevisiae AWRI1631]